MSKIKQQHFFGASIRRWNNNIGWNGGASSLSIDVVEDRRNGETFNPASIGSAVWFEYENGENGFVYTYGGILKSWTETGSVDGLPIYNVQIGDLSEILQGVQLITGSYSGPVQGIPNLLNCYGYLEEHLGFGGARVNPTGIPWNLLRVAINALTNGIDPRYGSPIQYRGSSYRIDLSDLPNTPDYYRVGGDNISLLDAISQVCQDTGRDFYIDTLYNSGTWLIKIRTVSRIGIPPLGQIQSFVQSAGNVPSYTHGLELRNETTSAFVIGGLQETLFQYSQSDEESPSSAQIWPYWGIDANGNAIIGGPDKVSEENHVFTVDSRQVNAFGVGDTYTMDVGEIRAAAASYEVWASYVTFRWKAKAEAMGLIGGPWGAVSIHLLNELIRGNAFPRAFVDAGIRNAKQADFKFAARHLLGGIQSEHIDYLHTSLNNVYEFVRRYASEYFGKKWLVKIPDVSAKLDPDTQQIILGAEPSDGGYLPEGSEPLGIPAAMEPLFTQEDGRFVAFARFDVTDNVEIPGNTQDTMILIGDYLYVKGQVESIVFADRANLADPRAILALESPVFVFDKENPAWMAGVLEILKLVLNAELLQKQDRQVFEKLEEDDLIEKQEDGTFRLTQLAIEHIKKVLSRYAGGFALAGLSQNVAEPTDVALPFRSNTLRYGPWFNVGPAGQVQYEQDDSLVPWNYGGYTGLNLAGRAKVDEAVAHMQVGEVGDIVIPSAPSIQLGSVLQLGGPNITGIDVDISEGGIKTTYRMRTYTPKVAGQMFGRQRVEQIQKTGRTLQQFRRNLKLHSTKYKSKGFYDFRQNFVQQNIKAIKDSTPHDVIMAQVVPGVGGSGYRTAVSTMELREAIAACPVDDENEYKSIAIVGGEAIYRPFSMDPEASGITKIGVPKEDAAQPTLHDLNPFSGDPDIDIMTYGDMFPGKEEYGEGADANTVFKNIRTSDEGFDPHKSRGVCLRGPLWIAGWGYDTNGQPVPNEGPENPHKFLHNHRRRIDKHKVGPLDVRWDEDRQVWAASTPNLSYRVGKIIGYNEITSSMPTYLVQPISGITYDAHVSGTLTVPNIAELGYQVHSIPSGSLVLVYDTPNQDTEFGRNSYFMNEHNRSLVY